MAGEQELIDLERFALRSGQAKRLDSRVLAGNFSFGGESYRAAEAEALVDISRTVSGYALRLRTEIDIAGPCSRCLQEVTHRFAIDAREIHDQSTDDEELLSPYVDDGLLDLTAWARNEIALELPDRFRNPPDDEGICGACDRSIEEVLGAQAQAAEPALDPRWAKLRELQE
ncbi:MAG: YceD family protein [Solirubrobacterales bacterium]